MLIEIRATHAKGSEEIQFKWSHNTHLCKRILSVKQFFDQIGISICSAEKS